jgi:hypothetical protein
MTLSGSSASMVDVCRRTGRLDGVAYFSTQVAGNKMNAWPHLAKDGTSHNTGQIESTGRGACKRGERKREGESLVSPHPGAFV